MFNFRTVLKPDGSRHVERDIGNMRIDQTDGSITRKISQLGDTQRVMRPDGSFGTERIVGNMRYNLETGKFDRLF